MTDNVLILKIDIGSGLGTVGEITGLTLGPETRKRTEHVDRSAGFPRVTFVSFIVTLEAHFTWRKMKDPGLWERARTEPPGNDGGFVVVIEDGGKDYLKAERGIAEKVRAVVAPAPGAPAGGRWETEETTLLLTYHAVDNENDF